MTLDSRCLPLVLVGTPTLAADTALAHLRLLAMTLVLVLDFTRTLRTITRQANTFHYHCSSSIQAPSPKATCKAQRELKWKAGGARRVWTEADQLSWRARMLTFFAKHDGESDAQRRKRLKFGISKVPRQATLHFMEDLSNAMRGALVGKMCKLTGLVLCLCCVVVAIINDPRGVAVGAHAHSTFAMSFFCWNQAIQSLDTLGAGKRWRDYAGQDDLLADASPRNKS